MPRPNIIFILADDMGYGDMRCNSSQCAIPTPNLDRLAQGGMRFTDAHAASSLCTPSRYNILTGRYAWRSQLKSGIVWEWDAPLIEPDRPTVASLLKSQGYHTACIGKWHLGWDWPTLDGRHPNQTLPFGVHGGPAYRDRHAFANNIDYAGRLGGGPVDRGFDSYFGVDVPNFSPYTWFENDRLAILPTVDKPDTYYGHPGKAVPDWDHKAMIPAFTRRAVELIESHAPAAQDANHARPRQENRTPFFLYLPLTSPHSPVVPNQPFVGRSGIGLYGDFVCEVDWVVGQIIDALERTGQADDTLLIFTSDNGPENRTPDDEGVYERARRTSHYSMGPLRGMKRDAWEGGHRVPFVARWPRVIPPATRCDQLVCLGDFMATCADIIGSPLPAGAAEDSISMLPLLQTPSHQHQPTRDHLVHHSGSGKFALRTGQWVYIDAPSGADNPEPDWYQTQRSYQPHSEPAELFNLADDLAERTNQHAQHPDLANQLASWLEQIKAGHTTAHHDAMGKQTE